MHRHMGVKKSPVGIMLVNVGIPDEPSVEAVSRYFRNFIGDNRIFGKLGSIAYWATHASQYRKMLYDAVDRYTEVCDEDGFEFVKIGARQRRMLIDELRKMGVVNAIVSMAYRFGNPSMKSGLDHLVKNGCKHIVIVPLYPQSSYMLTASVHDEFRRQARRLPRGIEYRFIDNFYDDPGYIDVIANNISSAPDFELRKPKVVFAYRSVPLKDIARGDTYELQTSATSLAIANRLEMPRKQWTISYIPYDHLGLQKVLAPTVSETVERFHMAKIRDVLVVCPGVVTDSVDTIFEVDTRMRDQFESGYAGSADGCSFTYVEAPNDSPEFVSALADIIFGNLYGWEEHYMYAGGMRGAASIAAGGAKRAPRQSTAKSAKSRLSDFPNPENMALPITGAQAGVDDFRQVAEMPEGSSISMRPVSEAGVSGDAAPVNEPSGVSNIPDPQDRPHRPAHIASRGGSLQDDSRNLDLPDFEPEDPNQRPTGNHLIK